MISRISGTITRIQESVITIRASGLSYDVILPIAVMEALGHESKLSGEIELVTYHYFQIGQSSGVPVLIGFQNDVEKEFFEKFISVSGVGPKAACKALSQPFPLIAGAIDNGDESFLKGLSGIGGRKAAEIIAKLKGKVGKYGLLKYKEVRKVGSAHADITDEALSVLEQLQYKKTEAENMIRKAMERSPEIKTSEELLNEIYRENR